MREEQGKYILKNRVSIRIMCVNLTTKAVRTEINVRTNQNPTSY